MFRTKDDPRHARTTRWRMHASTQYGLTAYQRNQL